MYTSQVDPSAEFSSKQQDCTNGKNCVKYKGDQKFERALKTLLHVFYLFEILIIGI